MNAITGITAADPLAKLREPFKPNHISKLPKPTKAQTEAVRADYKKGVRCKDCGSWHHPEVVHLDYVGHAALTDRLLDTDPHWSWEPVAFRDGLPAFDATGGLWIRLTVCGVSRLGYGHAAAKNGVDPGAREKEVIGDALRNAAMRFGAALDLWHKGDLHADDDEAPAAEVKPRASSQQESSQSSAPTGNATTVKEPPAGWGAYATDAIAFIGRAKTEEVLNEMVVSEKANLAAIKKADPKMHADIIKAAKDRRAVLQGEILDDEVPF